MKKVNGIKEKIKAQYSILSEIFESWYFNKLREITVDKNVKRPPKNLLKKLAMSEKKFYEIYIKPFKSLTKQELNTVFEILAPELLETYTKIEFDLYESIPFNGQLKYDLSSVRKENALNWLLFQVDLLGIFNISKKLNKLLIEPYHQCYYCGKPNFYIRNGVTKNFNLKETFCHKDYCQSGSNPEKHDNCCYSKWARKRKSLEKALSVYEKLISDIIENYEDYEDNNASHEQKAILDNKLNEIFIKFCEKQYQENLKINYTIQTISVDAINLMDNNL